MAKKKKVVPEKHVETALADPAVAKFREETKIPKPTINLPAVIVDKDGKPVLPKVPIQFGRPTDYRPEYCVLLVWHMSQGMSFETFGALDEVNAGRATLYKWLDKHPDFVDAKDQGTTKCRQWWERLGNRYSVNNYKGSGESINAGVYKLNMQNRFGWADKQEQVNPNSSSKSLHDQIMDEIHGEDDEQ